MTLMLASVAGTDEAEFAVARGVDIVNLGNGAAATVRAVADAVGDRATVSAAAGDAASAEALADAGARDILIAPRSGQRLEALAGRVRLIGVLFAHAADETQLPRLKASGFAGVMLDTPKSSDRLLDHMDIAALGRFVQAARASELAIGFAGSIEAPDIPRLLLLQPDMLGFRATPLDLHAIAMFRALIPHDPRASAPAGQAPAAVYRLPRRDEISTDRIFVRDLVLPMSIGAYARERDKPQNVRFDVEASVLRGDHPAADMRDVFSYDLIMDGIRMIIARDHIPLVETLAERIAAYVLAHPRVTKVTVRVEKLDVGPGGVGVEMVRERPTEAATVHQLHRDADPKVAT
jgi:(5-formylfuran-3-yl)methyl phosphate synthase